MLSLWKDAEEERMEEGKRYFSQRLTNAKRAYNSVVCSVNTTRIWYADENGDVFVAKSDLAKIQAETLKKSIPRLMPGASVSKVTSQKRRYGTVWRFEVFFGNEGRSRILEAYTYYKGFVHRLSATYSASEDKYWRARFDDILERWQPGGTLGEIAAARVGTEADPGGWQEIVLRNGGTIYVPAAWQTVYRDSPVETEISPEGVISTQKCLNMRMQGLTSHERPTFLVWALWTEDELRTSDDELEQFAMEMVDSAILELGFVSIRSIKKERYDTGTQNVPVLTYESDFAPSLPMRMKWVVLRHEHKLVCFQLSYLAQNEAAWDAICKQILTRWKVDALRGYRQSLDEILGIGAFAENGPISETPLPAAGAAAKNKNVRRSGNLEIGSVRILFWGMGCLILVAALYFMFFPANKKKTSGVLRSAPPKERPAGSAVIPPWERDERDRE